jgi:hypothetical protein
MPAQWPPPGRHIDRQGRRLSRSLRRSIHSAPRHVCSTGAKTSSASAKHYGQRLGEADRCRQSAHRSDLGVRAAILIPRVRHQRCRGVVHSDEGAFGTSEKTVRGSLKTPEGVLARLVRAATSGIFLSFTAERRTRSATHSRQSTQRH